MTDLSTSQDDPMTRFQALREEHRRLDEQIHDLDARPYLGPEDQVELVRLKKLKLRKKDEIATLAARLGVEI
jgi:uncharacterized protein YdcH (DUF465 family)